RSTELIPSPISVENFIAVFDPSNHFARALLNSLVVAGGTTILVLVLGVFGAYALARLDFRGKVLVMFLIVATSMFPVVTLVVPLLKLFSGGFVWFPFNWINTYQALILPTISFALPLAVWNLNAFFRQLPVELEQAAMVDGTTRFGAFLRVILPLAAPGVFTTAIITFIAAWNEFLIALTMVNAPLMQTANVAISKFTGISQFDTPYGTKMAAGPAPDRARRPRPRGMRPPRHERRSPVLRRDHFFVVVLFFRVVVRLAGAFFLAGPFARFSASFSTAMVSVISSTFSVARRGT